MDKKYQTIAGEKSADELIDIILDKDKYHPELVLEAEAELKARRKSKSIEIPEQKARETPPGIYLAAVLFFLGVPIWLHLALDQSILAVLWKEFGFLAIWSVLYVVASIVIGIGILQKHNWGYQWGLGIAIFNSFMILFLIFHEFLFGFLFFLVVKDLVICIALDVNKDIFQKKAVSPEERAKAHFNKLALTSEQLNEPDLSDKMGKLYKMIQKEKHSFFGSNKEEITELLIELCDTEENAEQVMNSYSLIYKSDLISDIMSLTSSYHTMKFYLHPFIELGIVEPEYPHKTGKETKIHS